jgi:hypothetical protein
MRHAWICFLLLTALIADVQTINLHGTVSNQAWNPVVGAVVTLAGQKLSDSTGADGSTYGIAATVLAQLPLSTPRNKLISMDKGVLTFSLPARAPVMVEIFGVRGTLLKRTVQPDAKAGFYRFNVAEYAHAAKLLLINATIGNEGLTFHYLPLSNGSYVMHASVASGTYAGAELAKIAAIDDTLKITAENYKDKTVAITSYDQ